MSYADVLQKRARMIFKTKVAGSDSEETKYKKIKNILPTISSKNVKLLRASVPNFDFINVSHQKKAKQSARRQPYLFPHNTVPVVHTVDSTHSGGNSNKHPHNSVPVVHTVDSIHSGVPTGVPRAKPSTQRGVPTGVPRTKPSTQRGAPTGVPSAKPSTIQVLVRRQRVKLSASLVIKQQQHPLRPCQKQHVNATSQSLQYQHSLPYRSRVSFGIITLPRQRPQTHQHHAYRAQNTIIDSYKVAIEVHEQNKYAAIDSGASGTFIQTTIKVNAMIQLLLQSVLVVQTKVL